jgi:hypothetical protein
MSGAGSAETGGLKVSNDEETSKQAEEDAKEDLDLEVEDADKVGGGQTIKFDKTTPLDKTSPLITPTDQTL